ncbi:MAG: hypothetical protein JWR75_838 [Devosia sp.]|nr:hypothetical protein [Devosia sp.]
MTGIVYGDDAMPQPADADEGRPIFALSIGEDEIAELMYGTDLSVDERLMRLEALRDEVRSFEGSDLGGDAASLLAEIEGALSDIRMGLDDDVNGVTSPEDLDGHGELLAADDDEKLDDEDEEDDVLDHDDTVIDPEEWTEDDDFDTDKGVI